MAIFGFCIGVALVLAGFVSLASSVNLVPTEMGMLYAVCGVILIGCGGVSLAVAAMIARIDRIVAPKPPATPEPQEGFAAPVDPPVDSAAAPAPAPAVVPAEEDDINLNRSGHLPSLRAVEEAIIEPEAPPQIVGRYAAGGANYVIFSDGTIEAETEDGGYRFASMDEFKAYLAGRKG
jgi:hypothetical protein